MIFMLNVLLIRAIHKLLLIYSFRLLTIPLKDGRKFVEEEIFLLNKLDGVDDVDVLFFSESVTVLYSLAFLILLIDI